MLKSHIRGEKFTLDEGLRYAIEMFKRDTHEFKDLIANRFISLEILKNELKERLILLGLKEVEK